MSSLMRKDLKDKGDASTEVGLVEEGNSKEDPSEKEPMEEEDPN